MPTIQVLLNFASLNTSVQVGDAVYYTLPAAQGGGFGFDYGQTSNTYYLGLIVSIVGSIINVQMNNDPPPVGTGTPPAGAAPQTHCVDTPLTARAHATRPHRRPYLNPTFPALAGL